MITRSISLIALTLMMAAPAVAQSAGTPAVAAPALAMAPAAPEAGAGMAFADRQQMHAVDAEQAQVAAQVKAVCGNASLNFKTEWAPYSTLNYSPAGPNAPKSQTLQVASKVASNIGNALSQNCAKDPAAKAELGKITEIKLTPRPDDSHGLSVHFALQGSVLNADFYPFAANGSQDLAYDVMKAF